MKFKFIAAVAALATITLSFTACDKADTCAYDESANTLSCSEKTYATVKVNNQVWMAENLVRRDMQGNSYCYGDKPENCTKYGSLYPFETAAKICPTGWTLPSKADFEAADLKALNVVKAGYRYASNGEYVDEGVSASFWTADSVDAARATIVRVTDSTVAYDNFSKNISYSVRCIKK